MMRRIPIVLVLLITSSHAFAEAGKSIVWQNWSDDIFSRAKAEHKFVLLDLGTTWCHWCHVMEAQTYSDPKVIELIDSKYIPVHVDADARPDLANRYEDYGWPATVVYNDAGGEIVKRRGYLDAGEMASMLSAIIADPTPGPSVTAAKEITFGSSTQLTTEIRDELLKTHLQSYDSVNGSWGHGQKFLNWESTEWAMRRAIHGDLAEEKMARQTLHEQLHLLDPAWGGVYQYSTDDDWQHPHFEKIMQMQTENLRIYSLAYAQFHDDEDLKAAQSIHGYLSLFLRGANGAFYTSQDADLVDGEHSADYFAKSDSDRRKLGVPRIDQHQYSRENGWAIAALACNFQMTGDATSLSEAIAAAKRIIANRTLDGGGFRHDEKDSSGPFLGDTLAMGQAFLQLYISTGDRSWLKLADSSADFISKHFSSDTMPGVMTAANSSGSLFTPGAEFDENVAVARWANLLWQYTGTEADKKLAEAAMKYLTTPAVATGHGIAIAGLLLADSEMSSPALHLTIVGSKNDPAAAKLFAVALATPMTFKRVDWFDPAEGPLPNSDVQFPSFPKAAGFVCTATTCSPPAFTVEDYAKRLAAAIRR